jgi:hypothetical protein
MVTCESRLGGASKVMVFSDHHHTGGSPGDNVQPPSREPWGASTSGMRSGWICGQDPARNDPPGADTEVRPSPHLPPPIVSSPEIP